MTFSIVQVHLKLHLNLPGKQAVKIKLHLNLDGHFIFNGLLPRASSNYLAVSGCECWGSMSIAGCSSRCAAVRFEAEQRLCTCSLSSLYLFEYMCLNANFPARTHAFPGKEARCLRRVVSYTGSGGCSHNILSLLAFFCDSKSGTMFVDAEGGMKLYMCVSVAV